MIDLIVGQTYEIPQREGSAVLRAYPRPRGQAAVSVEASETAVRVIALAPGYAMVDVIDEASEPSGVDYEFLVREGLSV